MDTLYAHADSFYRRGIKTMNIKLEDLNAGMKMQIFKIL
jgi:hypothetical protein